MSIAVWPRLCVAMSFTAGGAALQGRAAVPDNSMRLCKAIAAPPVLAWEEKRPQRIFDRRCGRGLRRALLLLVVG